MLSTRPPASFLFSVTLTLGTPAPPRASETVAQVQEVQTRQVGGRVTSRSAQGGSSKRSKERAWGWRDVLGLKTQSYTHTHTHTGKRLSFETSKALSSLSPESSKIKTRVRLVPLPKRHTISHTDQEILTTHPIPPGQDWDSPSSSSVLRTIFSVTEGCWVLLFKGELRAKTP